MAHINTQPAEVMDHPTAGYQSQIPPKRIVRVALAGLGSVHCALLTIFRDKAQLLEEKYGLTLRIVAVADSSGSAYCESGFVPNELHHLKAQGTRVCELEDAIQAGSSLQSILNPSRCDLLFEATPVSPQTGGVGLIYARHALQHGIHVVLANKGPLLNHFQELTNLAKLSGCQLAYSATVCGALPVINIGCRDLVAAKITKVRGIFNSTTNYILEQMSQGWTFDEALSEAQVRGIAEADPSLDIDGWDTANKLVIIANSILEQPTTLDKIVVTGIRSISTEDLIEAEQNGKTIKLIATATITSAGYQLTVAPTIVAQSEFLGSCNGWEMGIEIQTDIYGTLYHKSWEDTPLPTAAAMLRDAINIYR